MTIPDRNALADRPEAVPLALLAEMDPPCQHSLEAIDASGNCTGSWTCVQNEHGIRIECRQCGKFYGYIVPNEPIVDSQSPDESASDTVLAD